ncbi:MAG: hypothetical protein OXT09_09165 [Myxococcales bacterium]|nr:hypothetical protein [Myxococcales bacterium]
MAHRMERTRRRGHRRHAASLLALAVVSAWLVPACAADGGDGAPRSRDHSDAQGASCAATDPACAAPSDATSTSDPSAADAFGNADDTVVAPAPAPADGATGREAGLEHCGPGFYLGTYECEVDLAGLLFPLTGDVSFNLEINEEVVEGECGPSDEFCADLVIAEGSGTLFGLAGLTGFEAPLNGGLDCSTGEFRTDGLDGVYGPAISSDPADPDALWTVAQPPFGMFGGTLSGSHLGADPQVIDGTWDLADSAGGASCAGTFTVQLQP